ncbi:hypothetical protein [Labedaea rhizosphaerae]|uniref:Biotin synthase auxiliary protein n=1 Tax=Labedaea rhizosphaerae TaxID=598644 RepID=A0A4R6SC87_LABRH|nr:hypothetical protein [Labedaea rhizosphaerae]TDP97183.1 hypothetical protein EV186_103144 [Labedaea rhizosphaerae]
MDEQVYCGFCGQELTAHDLAGCVGARRAAMEPPRYCAHCARRMVVQVTPTGWSARCSRHGEVASG